MHVAELRGTEAIQREVWGLDDIDIVPAAQLRAAAHAGGHVAGAFQDGVLVGFAYGFVSLPHGRGMVGTGLHSHMVAVVERGRQRGVGRALKWFQRAWCLERGMRWVTWTFDPLQARNAHLNLNHLGVVCRDYLVDFYGPMAGPLGASVSDRLLALWLLESDRVVARATPTAIPSEAEVKRAVMTDDATAAGPREPVWVLRESDVLDAADEKEAVSAVHGNSAFLSALDERSGATSLLVAAPRDLDALRREHPGAIDAWRLALRAAIVPALEAGYAITGFRDGAYELRRRQEEDRLHNL